jgi:hypothetical protein
VRSPPIQPHRVLCDAAPLAPSCSCYPAMCVISSGWVAERVCSSTTTRTHAHTHTQSNPTALLGPLSHHHKALRPSEERICGLRVSTLALTACCKIAVVSSACAEHFCIAGRASPDHLHGYAIPCCCVCRCVSPATALPIAGCSWRPVRFARLSRHDAIATINCLSDWSPDGAGPLHRGLPTPISIRLEISTAPEPR